MEVFSFSILHKTSKQKKKKKRDAFVAFPSLSFVFAMRPYLLKGHSRPLTQLKYAELLFFGHVEQADGDIVGIDD